MGVWWWLDPLFFTGWVTLFVFGLLAWLVSKVKPYSNFPSFLALLGILPWIIWALSGIVKIAIDVLIIIWG